MSQLGGAKAKFSFTDSPVNHLLQQAPPPRKKVRKRKTHFKLGYSYAFLWVLEQLHEKRGESKRIHSPSPFSFFIIF